MDVLDHHLSTFALKPSILPSIRAAANLAKKTLNRYYSRTDESDAYRIAMGMYAHRFRHTFSCFG